MESTVLNADDVDVVAVSPDWAFTDSVDENDCSALDFLPSFFLTAPCFFLSVVCHFVALCLHCIFSLELV
jgi:hypothetical protein